MNKNVTDVLMQLSVTIGTRYALYVLKYFRQHCVCSELELCYFVHTLPLTTKSGDCNKTKRKLCVSQNYICFKALFTEYRTLFEFYFIRHVTY